MHRKSVEHRKTYSTIIQPDVFSKFCFTWKQFKYSVFCCRFFFPSFHRSRFASPGRAGSCPGGAAPQVRWWTWTLSFLTRHVGTAATPDWAPGGGGGVATGRGARLSFRGARRPASDARWEVNKRGSECGLRPRLPASPAAVRRGPHSSAEQTFGDHRWISKVGQKGLKPQELCIFRCLVHK